MAQEKGYNSPLEMQPLFSQLKRSQELIDHFAQAKLLLEQLIPDQVLLGSLESIRKWFSTVLPIVKWEKPDTTPTGLKIHFLSPISQEVQAEKVLPELLRKWLIPEKEVHIFSFTTTHFYLPAISDKVYFMAEVQVLIEEGKDLETIGYNLPLISSELGYCLSSARYLANTIDTKPLFLDQKSTQVQFYLRKLLQKAPRFVSTEVFREMGQFFSLTAPEFQKHRHPKHIARVIASFFLMRKNLVHVHSLSPEKRHLEFRVIRTSLHFTFGTKPVLGLVVNVALADRYESFEDTHILSAVQKFVPSAQLVKGSYSCYQIHRDPIKCLYVELEQRGGGAFSSSEIELLREELKEELKRRVEKLIPSVFMTRNEEEIMRNTLILSQELKDVDDLPQVMIHFDKQGPDELFFTVLLVRALKKGALSIEKAFLEAATGVQFIPDRVQNVGFLKKKFPKEVNVFHLSISNDPSVLRADSSVNFYVARQKVIEAIFKAIGEVRDYNGGMILKQGELFAQFRHAFRHIAQKNQELLENFFFGLTPIEAQATSSLPSLGTLFELLLEATEALLPKRESAFHKVFRKKNLSFAVIRTKDASFEKDLAEDLGTLEDSPRHLVRTKLRYQGTLIHAFLFEGTSDEHQTEFEAKLSSSLERWSTKISKLQELRLSFIDLPPSLDPRLGGDELSNALVKMLYEGLTRIDKEGKPALALAKSVSISPDFKHYVFTLREATWSDGKKIVAADFEYAWKKILTPEFYTPFANFFFPIKNAKRAKEGECPLSDVGIKVRDELTLEVELDHPTLEFLELTAHTLFSPIQAEIDNRVPNWAQGDEETYVCNGPFRIEKVSSHGGYLFVKNPNYWDKEEVRLDRITITKNNGETAFEMYKSGETDWLGKPLRPFESYFTGASGEIHKKPVSTYWGVINVQRFPFDHKKMRQAFAYAINQEAIAGQLPMHPLPASTPLPLNHSQRRDPSSVKFDPKRAKELFKEALVELGLNLSEFPLLTLIYTGGKSRELTARSIVEQWATVLGVPCRVEHYDFHILFSKMVKGDYQIGTMAWKSWINDPIYTLDTFQYRSNRVNFSKWEHPKYQKLIDLARRELNVEKRKEFYRLAEDLLIDEVPVIPIHFEVQTFLRRSNVKGEVISETGDVDFKYAYISS